MAGESARDDSVVRWELGSQTGSVEFPASLLEELVETVMAGFRRAPWGGPEVGGVLFGTREEGSIRLVTHRLVDCEHAEGPAFELSEADEQGLAQLLREGVEGLEPVGWYHSRYRDCSISATNAGVFDRHFPAPWQVTLVFGRDRDQPCVVEVHSRRRNGTLQSARPRAAVKTTPPPAPDVIAEPVRPPEPEAIRTAAPAPVAAPVAAPEPATLSPAALEPVPEPIPEPAHVVASAPPQPAKSGEAESLLSVPVLSGTVFWSSQHEEALGRLLYGVRGRRGLAILTGEAGTGKTTVLKCLAEHLCQDHAEFAFLLHSRFSAAQFYEMLAYDLALDCPRRSKSEVVAALTRLMQGQAARGLTTALVIDDAHSLEREVLDEIQWLDSLPSRKDKLLQIVLAGQPALDRIMQAEDLGPLKIAVRCSLGPFSEQETLAYLAHYLTEAGMKDQNIFPEALAGEIHHRCQGIAGTIRAVCDHLLKTCAARKARVATLEMLDRACDNLRLAAGDSALEHA